MRRAFPTLLTIAVIIAAGGAIVPRAAASTNGVVESWDWPTAIGVSSASEVYVGLQVDTGGKVAHLAADGAWLGDWRTDGPMKDLTVGIDRSVYTVMDRSGRVYHFASDGTPTGMWHASYFSSKVASGPLGETASGSVYVLWTPQRIGEPPSGPPRITRYSARGEALAEWEVTPFAYDIAVVVTDAAPQGIVHVADSGGLISRYAPDGTPQGEWRAVTAEGRRIAAAPGGLLYLAFSGELWRYAETGSGSLACSLPAGEPRDVAADPREGDIYILYPDSVLRLAPDCTVRARFSHEQLLGEATATPGTAVSSATPAESPTTGATLPPTETPLPTPTPPATPSTEAPTATTAAPRTGETCIYLPAALNDGLFQQTPVATRPALPTSTPFPTQPPGTPGAPTPTATPGAVAPSFLVAVGTVSDPDVAGDAARTDCQHLVAWLDQAGKGAIWARFVRPEGLGEPFLVSAEAGANGPPALAYSAAAAKWFVVWAEPDDQSVSAIRGRIVGCPAPEDAVIEVGHYLLIEDQPVVAADGDGFAVVWRRSFSGRPDFQLVGARVTGATVSEPQALGDPGSISDPALDCEGGGPCLVAWADGPEYHQNILARAWTPRSGAVGSDVLQIAVDNRDFGPSVAWNATPGVTAYAVAWSVEWRYRAVYARSVRGGVLGPEIEVDMSLGGSFTPDISPLGNGFVTAYARSGPMPEYDQVIKLARLAYTPDTGVLVTMDESVVLSGNAPWVPAVSAFRDPEVLAVWQDQPSLGYGQIVGRYANLPSPTPVWP